MAATATPVSTEPTPTPAPTPTPPPAGQHRGRSHPHLAVGPATPLAPLAKGTRLAPTSLTLATRPAGASPA
ncbi:MAG: hypothetical protein R3D55_28105 [Chloroflexota bacterium]